MPREGGSGGPRRGPEAIGDLVRGFLQKEKLLGAIDREELAAAWRETVGAEIAAETRVRGERGGVLAVEVASSARLEELSVFYRRAILEALRERLGRKKDIREITFKVGVFPK